MCVSMPWFRLYNETVSDPKIQTLDLCSKWMWVTCLCIASASGERGALKFGNVPATFRELSSIAGIPLHAGELSLRKLIDRGMLLEGEDGCLIVKNWAQRQFSSDLSTERARRSKERKKAEATFRERSENVEATPQNTDNRIQIKDINTSAPSPQEQDLLQALYPHGIELKKLRELMEDFSDKDIRGEFRSAREWLDTPKGKKIKSIPLFLRNWLKRAQSKPKGTSAWVDENKEALDAWAQ